MKIFECEACKKSIAQITTNLQRVFTGEEMGALIAGLMRIMGDMPSVPNTEQKQRLEEAHSAIMKLCSIFDDNVRFAFIETACQIVDKANPLQEIRCIHMHTPKTETSHVH